MSVELDIQIVCETCGNDLEAEFEDNSHQYATITVAHCSKCMDAAENELRDRWHDAVGARLIIVHSCKECPYCQWDWAGNGTVDVPRCGQTETIITTPDDTISEWCPLRGI